MAIALTDGVAGLFYAVDFGFPDWLSFGGEYTFSYVLIGDIPPGLDFEQVDDVHSATMSGTPTADAEATSWAFSVETTTTWELPEPGSLVETQAYTLFILCPDVHVRQEPIVSALYLGLAHSSEFRANEGETGALPWEYTVEDGFALPAGLSLNASSGVLSGTPLSAGYVTPFQIRGTDAHGCSGVAEFSYWVYSAGVFPTSVLNGTVGVAYTPRLFELLADPIPLPGSGPVSFSVVAGSLPPGLSFLLAAGATRLRGTPTTAGVYTFTVRGLDEPSGYSATRAYTMTIAPGEGGGGVAPPACTDGSFPVDVI